MASEDRQVEDLDLALVTDVAPYNTANEEGNVYYGNVNEVMSTLEMHAKENSGLSYENTD